MSLRRFLGWEPKQTTTVTAWKDGQPAQWVTTTEPEWDRRERSLMLALNQWQAGQCPGCGQQLALSMDPGTDPYNPENSLKWVADGPDACFSCQALKTARDEIGKHEGGAHLLAYSHHRPMLVQVQPRTRLAHT